MEIKKQSDGSKLTVSLSGRLDTTTAPVFEKELKESLNGVSDLTLDFSGLEYISSAGLRVLLSAQKLLNAAGGKMKVAGANEIVKEIFDGTGFSDILTIEEETILIKSADLYGTQGQCVCLPESGCMELSLVVHFYRCAQCFLRYEMEFIRDDD